MAHRAAVLVKLPASLIESEFTPVDNPGLPGDKSWKGANGVPFATKALEDGTILYTLAPYEGEPDEAAYMARSALGKVLDNHVDKRGLLVFPDGAAVTARSYEGAVGDVAELGDWTPVVSQDYVPSRLANAQSGSLEGRMRDVVGAIPQDLLAQMQAAMASGDMSALMGMQGHLEQALAAQGGLQGLQQLVGDVLAQQGMSMEQVMSSMGGGGGAEAGGDEGAEVEAMLRQSKGELDALKQSDPTRWRELDAQFGGALTRMDAEDTRKG